jgi:hypothetical protein
LGAIIKKNSVTERIYYADKEILNTIKTDFDLIDDKGWYQLYQNKTDKTFWRLDKWDKFQEQFFVRLDTSDNWIEFDSKEFCIDLLRKSRGISDKKCIWKDCTNFSLQGIVFCERHAYEEMGLRK